MNDIDFALILLIGLALPIYPVLATVFGWPFYCAEIFLTIVGIVTLVLAIKAFFEGVV